VPDFQYRSCRFSVATLPDSTGDKTLYEVVAEKASEWNKNGNVGLVVGATYPKS
jgi:hypothetical protein